MIWVRVLFTQSPEGWISPLEQELAVGREHEGREVLGRAVILLVDVAPRPRVLEERADEERVVVVHHTAELGSAQSEVVEDGIMVDLVRVPLLVDQAEPPATMQAHLRRVGLPGVRHVVQVAIQVRERLLHAWNREVEIDGPVVGVEGLDHLLHVTAPADEDKREACRGTLTLLLHLGHPLLRIAVLSLVDQVFAHLLHLKDEGLVGMEDVEPDVLRHERRQQRQMLAGVGIVDSLVDVEDVVDVVEAAPREEQEIGSELLQSRMLDDRNLNALGAVHRQEMIEDIVLPSLHTDMDSFPKRFLHRLDHIH